MQNPNTPTNPPTRRDWTVLSLIDWATAYLKDRGFDDARLNVELLLSHILHTARIGLYTGFDRPLSEADLAAFKSLFRRRLEHEPVQYILGETEFMGMPLRVNNTVLIPRPETELLVERAVELLKHSSRHQPEVLEIGTGSGNIAIATAVLAPSTRVTSVDLSRPALELAERNAERNNAGNVKFLLADARLEFLPGSEFDMVVSNPPYVSLEEFETLQPEVRDFEPRLAITDEGDGYRFIERIIQIASEKLSPEGVLLLEIAYNQAERVRALMTDWKDVRLIKDYSGIERIVEARRS